MTPAPTSQAANSLQAFNQPVECSWLSPGCQHIALGFLWPADAGLCHVHYLPEVQ